MPLGVRAVGLWQLWSRKLPGVPVQSFRIQNLKINQDRQSLCHDTDLTDILKLHQLIKVMMIIYNTTALGTVDQKFRNTQAKGRVI